MPDRIWSYSKRPDRHFRRAWAWLGEPQAEALHPVTREIIGKSRDFLAADAYRALYRPKELKRLADQAWVLADCIVTPTAGTIYTIAEVETDHRSASAASSLPTARATAHGGWRAWLGAKAA